LLSFIVLVQFSTQKIILTAIKRLGETYSAWVESPRERFAR
jgi:hypothetical protein